MIAVTVVTPFLTAQERIDAIRIARKLKIKHHMRKISLPARVMRNPEDRCYQCKRVIFSSLKDYARTQGYAVVMEGSTHDDIHDYRPGERALKELKIRSPLKEAGWTKAEIRRVSRDKGLCTWDKPSCSCMATRIPYNEDITLPKLAMLTRAEDFLRKFGFYDVRVRLHGEAARIEVDQKKIPILMKNSAKIIRHLKSLGLKYICLDLEGYRAGSMNEAIIWKRRKS